jgi:hypothetical protein
MAAAPHRPSKAELAKRANLACMKVADYVNRQRSSRPTPA